MPEKDISFLSDQELRQLEVETFEIEDMADAGQLAASESTSSTSTCSSTTSCTSTSN